MHNN